MTSGVSATRIELLDDGRWFMATIMLIFLITLGLAAMLGWTTDTRDGADWKPDDDRLLRERRVSNL
ncbi:MAG: hypothetical protein M3Z25_04135 [Actinomycetota bacterium]|nr:hypothetical protein [Actinomycetota bacterium]